MKNKILRRLSLIVSLIMLITSSVNVTFGFVVTKTESIINTFLPFESVMNHILITKNVEHPFGDDYVIPDAITFDFKVELGDLYANTTIKTTQGKLVTDEFGNIVVSIKPGESISIEDVDAGTKVRVSELATAHAGFSVKDGVNTKEIIVAADEVVRADFINVYSPEKIQANAISIQGKKILNGRKWEESDQFNFILEQKQADGTWAHLSTKSVQYDSRNTQFDRFSFDDCIQSLYFEKPGIYDFRMREIKGNDENIEYDANEYMFSIHVTDVDMDGKLEINKVSGKQGIAIEERNGQCILSVNFNNTFIPDPEDISVSFNIDKIVKNTGINSITPEGFKFILENKETHKKEYATSNQLGNAAFNCTYTVGDIGKTYSYLIYEVDEDKENVTYDITVYEVEASIVKEGNILKAILKLDGKQVNEVMVEFENIYHVESEGPPTGDSTHIHFWYVMLMVSSIACVSILLLEKKYRREND